MGKRKISVEEFTNDVLAGMSDDELMKKYRISRRNLDAMLAKLLQRGELRPADLADATQKALEPTLELAATCPQCGALNLFGAGQCPECGQSRVTRHFKAIDSQEAEPLQSESSIEISKQEAKSEVVPQDLEDSAESPFSEDVELQGLEDLRAAGVPEIMEDVPLTDDIRAIPPRPQLRSRKPFLYIAVAALFMLVGAVGAGLYTGMISLPFGTQTPPPAAVQQPPKPRETPGPPTKRIAATSPKPAAQPPKAVSEPVKEPPPPVPEEAPAPSEAKPKPVEEPKKVAQDDNQSRPPEQTTLEPTVDESPQPPAAETATEPPREKVQEPEPVPVTSPEPAPKLAADAPPPVPVVGDRHEPRPQRHAALEPPIPTHQETPAPPRRDMEPLLIDAIKNSDPNMLNVLLDRGADPDSADAEGATALMYAARTRCLSCVAALLNRGADVRLTDRRGTTALDMARRAGRTRAAELILAHDPEKGPAALLIACQEGLADIVQVLVENGVDVNATDTRGNTALMAAAERGNLAIVSMLLKKGADVRSRNKQGQTALTILSRSGSSSGRVPSRVRRELVRMLEPKSTQDKSPLRPGR